jgi:hypothetical protein
VRPEAHDRHHRQDRQRDGCGRGQTRSLAPAAGTQQQEWQHQPGRGLHAHAGHHRDRRAACARRGRRAQRQRPGQREQHERVVVRAPGRQLEQNRVEPHERRRHAGRAARAARGVRHQRNRRQARAHHGRLDRPQPAGQPQRHERVARKRERRAIGRVLKGPAHEREHGVGRRFGGHTRVRVQAVEHAHARERQIAKRVLGEQRRSQQQRHMGPGDGKRDRRQRQPARGGQREQIARAHGQRERLKAGRVKAHAQVRQRPGQPHVPSAAARRDVARGVPGGARRQQPHARHDRRQTGCARPCERARADRRARLRALRGATVRRDR